MKMMVEGKTKDELVSVTGYEYGLEQPIGKGDKKAGENNLKLIGIAMMIMGMKLSGFGREQRQHRTIREMSSYQGPIKRRLRPFMSGDIMMDSTN